MKKAFVSTGITLKQLSKVRLPMLEEGGKKACQ